MARRPAVIVVNGKAGVEVGTQKAWDFCEKYNLPRIMFVTNMDDDNASYRQVIEDLQGLYGEQGSRRSIFPSVKTSGLWAL